VTNPSHVAPTSQSDVTITAIEARAVNVPIEYATLNEDIKVVRALRKAISNDMELLVDYNQGLSRTEAVRRGLALSNEGVSWIEEPVLQDDYLGHASIRKSYRSQFKWARTGVALKR
jgi:mandelate racemase